MPSKAETLPPMTPRNAVADAMMVAQAAFIHDAVGAIPPSQKISESLLADSINIISEGKCYEASSLVVGHLREKYPDLFIRLGYVAATATYDFENHRVFLVQGTDGMWYAGGPANNTSGKKRFTILYESENLEEILSKLRKVEGGRWPSREKVEAKMNPLQKK